MPSIRGSSKGDLYIEILVETPVNLNAEQIQLLKQFENSCRDNNPANKDFLVKSKILEHKLNEKIMSNTEENLNEFDETVEETKNKKKILLRR